MSVAIFTPTPYINKWQVSLCNNLYKFHGAPRTLTWQSLSLMQCHLHNVGRQARANTLRMLMRLKKQGRKEMFYLTMYSTHFIHGYMASDIWYRTTQIAREETRCWLIGYSFRLAARVYLYAPSNRQDSTYHGLCYTSSGALTGARNNWLGPPWRIDPTTDRTMSKRSFHWATSRSLEKPDTERFAVTSGSVMAPVLIRLLTVLMVKRDDFPDAHSRNGIV